jgi:ABC-type lipoprotein export system ATPase subunit
VTPALYLSGIVRDYGALRPLRIERLDVEAGEIVAVLGIDQPASETIVNLITGTTLPDRGEVRVFGLSTAQIRDGEEWMSIVDRFGFVSERAVLLEGLSVAQNLSIPFSLDVEPPSPELRERAVALAKEVGLGSSTWDARVGGLDALSRARVRLGRALALEPSIVLFEHPTAAMPGKSDVQAFGRQLREALERRGAAALILTADRFFAESASGRILTLAPSTGRLATIRPGWLDRFRRA